MSPRTGSRLVLASALTLCLLVGAAAASAATPQGFPQEIVLPKNVLPVFLISVEEVFDHRGVRSSETVVFELDQTVSDSRRVRRHFARLFKRLGWDGSFEKAAGRAQGSFTDGTVTVDVGVAVAGTGPAQIVVRVPLD